MPEPLENPLYYLHNFRQVLDWLAQRYADLLDAAEAHCIQHFDKLPPTSTARAQTLTVSGMVLKAQSRGSGRLSTDLWALVARATLGAT